jgi:glycosyltransferase involved in cell wall biosynthesis
VNISVVIPLYNEEESLKELFSSIKKVMTENNYSYEVIFVDDGSSDKSFEIIKELFATESADTIKAISFGQNYGKSAALSVGFAAAKGDYVVTMDADLQDDPLAIPDLVKEIERGFDVVSGWKKVRLDPVFTKNIPSKVFNFVVSGMSGLKLHDFNCGFKIYRKEAAKSLEVYGERHRFLPILAHWNGYKIGEYPVPHHQRIYGKSKFGLNRFFNGAFDLATLLFLKRYMRSPLHFFGMISFLLMLVGGGILTYFGAVWISTFQLHVRPLLLLGVTSVILGVQFFSIGLVGEMITNINKERKYTIKKTIGINRL